MYRFLIIIETGEHNHSAYVPDLPGCVTTGRTLEEVEENMRQALALHLQGMLEERAPLPTPRSVAAYVEVQRSSRDGLA
jgi:predicted RNase H-like HicB family nuclease